MINLLKCEFKKFKRTYINALSLLGMLAPVVLVFLMFLIKGDDLMKAGHYDWKTFNSYLTPFFMFLVGPIITSFIAVFSIFYEYQEKTMKNLLSSPHGRIKIILSKMIYVSAYVVLQYAVVALVNAVCGFVLGFDMTWKDIMSYSSDTVLAGLTTVILVPFMMFITLLSRSFIPAMVITVCGTIANTLALNWEKSYLSPWAIPADIVFILNKSLKMNLMYPLMSLGAYLIIFMALTMAYFKRADQSV